MICYCFDENEASMAREFTRTVGATPRDGFETILRPVAVPAKCGTHAPPAAWETS